MENRNEAMTVEPTENGSQIDLAMEDTDNIIRHLKLALNILLILALHSLKIPTDVSITQLKCNTFLGV